MKNTEKAKVQQNISTSEKIEKQYVVTDEKCVLLDLNNINGIVHPDGNRLIYIGNSKFHPSIVNISIEETKFSNNKISEIFKHNYLSLNMFEKEFYVNNKKVNIYKCKFYITESHDSRQSYLKEIDRNALHKHLEDETTLDSLMFLAKFSTNDFQLKELYYDLTVRSALLPEKLFKDCETVEERGNLKNKIRLEILKNLHFNPHNFIVDKDSHIAERLAVVSNPNTTKINLLYLANKDRDCSVLNKIIEHPKTDSEVIESLIKNITKNIEQEYVHPLLLKLFKVVKTRANKNIHINNNILATFKEHIVTHIEDVLSYVTNSYDITSQNNEEDITISVTIKKQ